MKEPIVIMSKDVLQRIAEINQRKGTWKAIGNLAMHSKGKGSWYSLGERMSPL